MTTTSAELAPIFQLPPIVLERIQVSVVLELLRQRVNKNYMPTAKGVVLYNSKPSYVGNSLTEHEGFPSVRSNESSGFYAVDTYLSGRLTQKAIFANINTAGFQILVNLSTCETIVRQVSLKSFTPNLSVCWPDSPEHVLPISRSDLEQHIDIYL